MIVRVCSRCGGGLDTDGKMCSKCREISNRKSKERREWYLSNGICPYCGSEKLFGSERSCPECRAKRMNATEKTRNRQYEKFLEQSASSKRKKYHERKEQGLCVRCGKYKPIDGRTKCVRCTNQRQRYEQEERERKGIFISRGERVAYGFCYTCGCPLDRDGRTCVSCAERMTQNLPGERGGNVYWRQQNKMIAYK